jgi:vanillate O-demethylase ferredoxin subunit
MRTITTTITKISPAGGGAMRIVLADPDDWPLPPFAPGGHIDLHLPNRLIRTYSLCNDPALHRSYIIAVKREEQGRGGSKYICDQLKPGDIIGVSLPRGRIDLGGRDVANIFIAGGIGITPFLSAVSMLNREGNRKYVLHAISRGEPPLRESLLHLRASGSIIFHDTTHQARPVIRNLIGCPREGVRIACCGPESMTEAFDIATREWPADQVHIERFIAPALLPDPEARPFTLLLARSNKSIEVSAGETVLAALRRMGVRVDASCEGGICGACRVRWIEGPPVHRDRILSEKERDIDVMVCVAGCSGTRLILDL